MEIYIKKMNAHIYTQMCINLKTKIIKPNNILIPYDYKHIGRAKTYIQFDIIVKYLRKREKKV